VGAFVEVDAALGAGAVEIVELDSLFEDIGVQVLVGTGGVGTGDVQEVAKFGEEDRVVGTFGCLRLSPARYKVLRRARVGHPAHGTTDGGRL